MKYRKSLLPLWIASVFTKEEADEIFSEHCGYCGKTFLEFLLSDQKPCPACGEAFLELAESLLALEQKAASPVVRDDKSPAGKQLTSETPAPDAKLVSLDMKERLEALIQDERYEEAAKVAERIKALKTAVPSN